MLNLSYISSARCPVCGQGFSQGLDEPAKTTLIMCDGCQTPHHYDCWKFIGGCSVYGCDGTNRSSLYISGASALDEFLLCVEHWYWANTRHAVFSVITALSSVVFFLSGPTVLFFPIQNGFVDFACGALVVSSIMLLVGLFGLFFFTVQTDLTQNAMLADLDNLTKLSLQRMDKALIKVKLGARFAIAECVTLVLNCLSQAFLFFVLCRFWEQGAGVVPASDVGQWIFAGFLFGALFVFPTIDTIVYMKRNHCALIQRKMLNVILRAS